MALGVATEVSGGGPCFAADSDGYSRMVCLCTYANSHRRILRAGVGPKVADCVALFSLDQVLCVLFVPLFTS